MHSVISLEINPFCVLDGESCSYFGNLGICKTFSYLRNWCSQICHSTHEVAHVDVASNRLECRSLTLDIMRACTDGFL